MLFVLLLAVFPATTRVAVSSSPGSETVEAYVRDRLMASGAELGAAADADLVLRLRVDNAGRTVSIDITDVEGTTSREIRAADADEAQALTWLVVRGAVDRAALQAPELPARVPELPIEAPAPPVVVPPAPVPTVVLAPVVAPAPVAPRSAPSWLRGRAMARTAPGIPGVLPLPIGVAVGVDAGETFALGVEAGWQLLVADDVLVHELPVALKAEWRASSTTALGVRAGFGPAIGVGTGKDVGVGVGIAGSVGAYTRLRLPLISEPLPVALAVEIGVEVRPLRPAFTTNRGTVLPDLFAVPVGFALELDAPPSVSP